MSEAGGHGRGFAIRRAAGDELDGVLGVLDAGNLETDADAVRGAIERGAVFVAESDWSTVVGALVLDGDEITHVAVRRRRRGQGIGTALVATAQEATDTDTLVSRFDPGVRPFYEALGFDIEREAEDRRYVGRLGSDQRFDEVSTGSE